MSTVEERVKKIVCEQLGVKESEVQNTSSFVEDLGADSLDTVELVMALEEEFETEIPDEEAEKLASVQDAIDYIVAHTRVTASADSACSDYSISTGTQIGAPPAVPFLTPCQKVSYTLTVVSKSVLYTLSSVQKCILRSI